MEKKNGGNEVWEVVRFFLGGGGGNGRDKPREGRPIGKCLQMSAGRFLARHVMDVSSSDAKTAVFGRKAAGASTARLDGGEVVCVGAVAEVNVAGGDNSVAETLSLELLLEIVVSSRMLMVDGEKVMFDVK